MAAKIYAGRGYYVRRLCRAVTRVSLSDWLALQARIRGFENPRLLRDRPSDGAALVCERFMRVVVENWLTVRGWCRKDEGVMVYARGARVY